MCFLVESTLCILTFSIMTKLVKMTNLNETNLYLSIYLIPKDIVLSIFEQTSTTGVSWSIRKKQVFYTCSYYTTQC